MKKLCMTLIATLVSAGAAWSAQQQARIEVSELFCPSCPYIAARAVKSVQSVRIVAADYDEAGEKITFLISYDDALTDAQTIAEAPMQYGYPGRVLDAQGGS